VEEWHARHTALHQDRLSHLERRRDLLVREVAAVEEAQAAALAAAGGYNPFDRLDDLLTREALEDDDAQDEDEGADGNSWLDLGKLRVRPARCCSSRHRPPFNSRNGSSKCVV